MVVVNTIRSIHELLSLAGEIAQVEHLDEKAALKRALAELPRLTNDDAANVRYQPKQPRRESRGLRRCRVKETV